MAQALRDLRALKTLRARIERVVGVGRNVSRQWVAVQREEESKAWGVLVKAENEEEEEQLKKMDNAVVGRKTRRKRAVWSARLTTLEFENCNLSAEQLGMLLSASQRCREVRLDGCQFLDSEVWTVLGEWEERSKLERLAVVDCGGYLGEEARTTIGLMDGLKVCSWVSPPPPILLPVSMNKIECANVERSTSISTNVRSKIQVPCSSVTVISGIYLSS